MWNLFHFAATQIVASVFDMAVDNLLRDGAVHPIGFAHMPTTHYPADFYPVKDDRHDIKAWRLCPCTTPLRLIA